MVRADALQYVMEVAARSKIERRIRFAFCCHASDNYETPTVEDMAEELRAFPRYEL